MSESFFKKPILNSPYGYPSRHWELDETGQPTNRIIEKRRRAEFITPIPKPKKRRAVLPKAVNEVDLSIAGTYREDGYLLAERGATMFSWGERVAVFVEPKGPEATEVEVVSMRAVAVNVTAAEFGNRLLNRIGEMLSAE